MTSWRGPAPGGGWFSVMLPLVALVGLASSSAVPAQASGEILVGRVADSPASVSPPVEEATPPGNLSEPRTLLLPQPVYPRAARAARQEGRVKVCFTLDERGVVREPVVRSSTDAVFNQPVLDAISAARFTPAKVGRQPIRSTACRTFQFVLR